MDNIKYHTWNYENIIPEEICNLIIKKYSSKTTEYGSIGENKINHQVRKVLNYQLEKDDWVTSIFHYYGFDANFSNFNYKVNTISNIQFLKYETGMFYNIHCDISNSLNRESFYRKLTIILDLSNPSEYEGGDFIIYTEGLTPIKLKQSKGSIHIFPSFYNHKITKIKKGERYSMVGWLLGEPFS